MASTSSQGLSIRPVAPPQWAEALALVFSAYSDEDRGRHVAATLAAARCSEESLAGLLGAYRNGVLVGAVFAQIQPGRTAMLCMPRTDHSESDATASQLLGASCQWLSQYDLSIAQVVMEAYTAAELGMLRRWGFDRLADLLYLVSVEDQFPHSPPPSELQFEPYGESNREQLARLIESTYEQTQDCPRLNGVRGIEDALASYRGTGVFDPQRWLFVRHQGRGVGCLLLTDHPQHANYELMYMGLVPQARGHRWGTQITRHAQWLTQQAGRPRLVLAVDTGNRPALATYAAVGFQAWDRRTVFVKILP